MNTTTRDPAQDAVREFFEYTPDTGVFVRIKSISFRRRDMVGKASGKPNKATGYVMLSVNGVKQYAHRLAWIYVNGPIPPGFYVDHINMVRWDNRIENLRLAKHGDNLCNSKVRRDSKTGVKGVHFDKARGKFMAMLGQRSLGRFDTLEEAKSVRTAAAIAAHGEFARE
jgi:hypothetical protein